MLLKELFIFESVMTTPSALDQLVQNANSMGTLYLDVLPDRINNLYAKGEHEDMYRTAKNVVGRAKGAWFAQNYMSTSSRRDKPVTGLKNALLALANDPNFSDQRKQLQELGSFVVMLNKEEQMKVAGSGGQYVNQLETLPSLMRALAPRAPGEFREKLQYSAKRLQSAVERFYALWERLQQKWNEEWGTPDPREQAREATRQQQTQTRQQQGSQQNQVEEIVNDVLGKLDRRTAAELRPILARSGNKLLTLQQELTKRNIKF